MDSNPRYATGPLGLVVAGTAPDTLPAEVREMLQRAGCQVRHFRQLLPGSMEDGRRVVVPVDQVEVRYVGNHGYQ